MLIATQSANIYYLLSLQKGAVQCSAMQCSAVQCSAVQCSAVQCSAICRLCPLDAVLSSGLCGKEGTLPPVTG